MIKASERLKRVHRVFDPYQDRRNFVRLDRNEDPAGWDKPHFDEMVRSLTPYDLAAYSDSTEFITKLSAWLDRGPEEIYVTAGSDAAIKNIFEAYVDPGERVVIQKPGWRMYDVYNDIYQGTPEFVEYGRELEFDAGRVIDLIEKMKIRLVVLANPNQPTGTLIERKILEQIIAAGTRRETIVVIDEAYHLYADETVVDLVPHHENLIVVRTFSKAFGLASLRLGYCVAQEARIRELMLLRPVTDANGLALKIGQYMLDRLDWALSRATAVKEGRSFLQNRVLASGRIAYPSHTNFLLVRYDSFAEAEDVVTECRHRNYLLKGPFTFSPLENCVRITLGPKSLMERFWTDCGDILALRKKEQAVR